MEEYGYILTTMFMFMWVYIIYHKNINQNNINAEPLHILFDDNNNKYIMININDIIDQKLIEQLFEELNKLKYSENDQYIGLNYDSNKETILVIPYNYLSYITFDTMITGVIHKIKDDNNKFELVPFKTIVKDSTIKGVIIKNKNFNINIKNDEPINNLYLKNLYHYDINNTLVPIYLLSNEIDNIKVKIRKF